MMGAIVLEILLWSSSSNLSCPWNPSLSATCFSRTFCKRMDTWSYFFLSFTGYTDHRPDFLLYVLCSLQLDEYTYIENSYVPIQVHILCMHVYTWLSHLYSLLAPCSHFHYNPKQPKYSLLCTLVGYKHTSWRSTLACGYGSSPAPLYFYVKKIQYELSSILHVHNMCLSCLVNFIIWNDIHIKCFSIVPEIEIVWDIVKKSFVKDNFSECLVGWAAFLHPLFVPHCILTDGIVSAGAWSSIAVWQKPFMFSNNMVENTCPYSL